MAVALSSSVRNGERIASQAVPRLSMEDFRDVIIDNVRDGARIVAMFGHRTPNENATRLFAVLADTNAGMLSLSSTDVAEKYPALTLDCPQAHWFEREIAEQCAVLPEGHPWLKPIRFQSSRPPGVTNFFQVEGEEIHEVAVGPVHAGVIEPGHFRFQCHGEDVLHLEIALGYQHRGVERALIGGPNKRTIHYMETLAGDTTIGHATAYCQAVEALSNCQPPARAQALRGVALELERLANHAGDLGALAGDVGYLPTASFCGRIRGDFLNITALLCGSRFGRGFVRPGGIGFDVDQARVAQLLERIETGAARCHDGDKSSCGTLRRCEHDSKTPERFREEPATTWDWSGRPRAPAAWSAMCDRNFRSAFTDSSNSPFRLFIPAMCLPARMSAGSKFRGQSLSSETNSRRCRRADSSANEIAPARTQWSCRWSKVGAAKFVTSRSPMSAGNSVITKLSILRFTTGSGWRWRCAASKSPTSRCATRASIFPTADTICEVTRC